MVFKCQVFKIQKYNTVYKFGLKSEVIKSMQTKKPEKRKESIKGRNQTIQTMCKSVAFSRRELRVPE